MIRLCLWMITLLLAACQPAQNPEGVLRVGLAQMPVSIDPRYATDAASMRVQQFLHRGLVRLDDHFQVQPDLAIRWQQISPLEWKFWIRRDVLFHDGSRLTASDVVATLNAILDKTMASPLRGGFSSVRLIRRLAGDQLLISLKQPDASLLTRLNIGILPARLASAAQQSRSTVGCGPFRFDKWVANTLQLQRVEPSVSGQHRPQIIRFTGVKDPVTRLLKITRGELDFIQNDLPPHLLPYVQQQPQLTLQTRPSTTFSYIGMNLQDTVLKDVRVRRALALSLNRRQLKKAMFADLPELAETVMTPDHWAATRLPETPFDVHKARALLDAAGFRAKEDGIRFTLTYRTSTDPTRIRLATAIASMWGEIGIRVSVESLEWGGFYARIKQGDFQVFSLSLVGISDPDIYRWILHSSMW
ncbi:MAG: ABC transporter substrate-binding protein, partial [Mariprofundaceae bacterium]